MITREIYYNVPHWAVYFMYVLTAIAVIIYGRLAYRITSQWIKNNKDQITDNSQAVRKFMQYIIAQKSVFTDRSAGIMHLLVVAGFLGLFVITLFVGLEADTPLHFLQGPFYVVISVLAEVFGLVLLIGLLFAVWRRLFNKPQYLSSSTIDVVLLALLLSITISGFLLEGLRIAAVGQWENWSPIGSVISLLFTQATTQTLAAVHFGFWLAHLVLAFGIIFLIPYTKLSHVLAAPINILTSDNPGSIKTLPVLSDIAGRDYLGTKAVQDLTGKNLIELYACTSCGRCEENCPAVLTGKILSPKKAIQAVRRSATCSAELDPVSIDVWNCTTCGYCTGKCPVAINHQNIIWGLRTFATTSGHLPPTGAAALENLEYLGDPWGTTPQLRSETREKLLGRKKPAAETPKYVYWPGCSINNDLRLREIAAALVKVLHKAGAQLDVIEGSIGCCGDPARRLGEEGLFQKLAEQNILLMQQKYAGSTIITHCPHCYHVLKNEYSRLGLELEVKHHSEVILELVQQGKLELPEQTKKRVVYHDPCYLGRHNNLYEPARQVMSSLPGLECVETERNRNSALCCGGGGGQMWLETQAGERANYLRLAEIQQLEPDLIITACPYCNMMLENAVSFKGLNHLEIKDIVEVFA